MIPNTFIMNRYEPAELLISIRLSDKCWCQWIIKEKLLRVQVIQEVNRKTAK